MGQSSNYYQAILMARKVEFLVDNKELFLYAGALYSAMMWGKKIDKKNRIIQERDKSLK